MAMSSRGSVVATGSKQSAFLSTNFRSAVAGRQARTLRAAPRPAGRSLGPVAEANLFSRVARIFKSYANAAVSAAEDPEKILDQAVTDMQQDLIRLRQAAAEVTASQKRLQNKYELAAKTADDWYRRAELALSKGDEELAKEALTRRKAFQAFQDNATMLQSQLEQQSKAVDTIIGNMRVLENKLAEAKMKKDTLKARAQSAKSAAAINDMIAGLDTSSALGAFERMEEKVMSLEAQAEAAQMLVAPSDVESKFRALEGSDVDDDLAKMKAALGSGKVAGQLPPGRPVSEAIDYELQDMKKRMGN
ncbi:putative membrane-associated 30 kDa chloroplastic [Chlorella sorokiniana]|uniref:Membrane-associated 30 kDa chloroplastic n=1 Tax=Chlorella sorokiniana TaxID=3076 RepID=A0A2P6TXP8_CHLSO|nr:putative membrane-associated 30 kDa chloroplastic [Chlorella sorokiniana]|eukprot:PRW58837.1 putative membrane-associated 30 kDa chloroplastic [Chlorella sorokiniana]